MEVARFVISLKYKKLDKAASSKTNLNSLSLFCLCFSTSFCSSSHQISTEESFYPLLSIYLRVSHFLLFLYFYLTSMLSIFSFHPILVPVSYCQFPSPVTFHLKHERSNLPILPLKLLWAWVFLSIRINLQTSTEMTQKSCCLEGWNNKTQFVYMKLCDTLQWATEPYSRILSALIDGYLSDLRLKWKWACHLSSLINATVCLKHRLCSASQLLYCKCLLSILCVICPCYYLGKKSISLRLVSSSIFNGA